MEEQKPEYVFLADLKECVDIRFLESHVFKLFE